MHESVERGNDETLKVLLEAGANTEARLLRENGYYTALQVACMHGREECVRLLIKHGADINAQNKDGWTPLREACFRGHFEATELLLKAGADMEIKCDGGIGPRDEAAGGCARLLKKYEKEKQ